MTRWALSLALLLALAAPAAAETPPWTGEVVAVMDGDSCVVQRGREPVQIRLYGIDAPERHQPGADEARAALMALKGLRVRVDGVDVDRHNRVVAWLWPISTDADSLSVESSVNAQLCRRGLAWWYQRYAPRAWGLARAMLEAAGARRGLWAEAAPTPPWDWRRGRR